MSELELLIQKMLDNDKRAIKKLRTIKNPNVNEINDIKIRFCAKFYFGINCRSEIGILSQQSGFFPLLEKLFILPTQENIIQSFEGQVFHDFTELTNMNVYCILFKYITITDEFVKAMPDNTFLWWLLQCDKKLIKEHWQKYSDQFTFDPILLSSIDYNFEYFESLKELAGNFNTVIEDYAIEIFDGYESLTIENYDCNIDHGFDVKVVANDLLNLSWTAYEKYNDEQFINYSSIVEIFDILDAEQRIVWSNRLKNTNINNFYYNIINSESHTAIEMTPEIFDHYRNYPIGEPSFVFWKSYVIHYPEDMGIAILSMINSEDDIHINDVLGEALTQKHIDEFVRMMKV